MFGRATRFLSGSVSVIAVITAMACAPEPLTRDGFDAGDNNNTSDMMTPTATGNNTPSNDMGTTTPGEDQGTTMPGEVTFATITGHFRATTCFNCHGGAPGVFGNFGASAAEMTNPTDAELRAAIEDVDAKDGGKILVPGDAESSSLYYCMKDADNNMGRCTGGMGAGSFGVLTPAQVEDIKTWINNGASFE